MGRPRTELNFQNATLEEVRREQDFTPTKNGFRRLQALLWFYEDKTYQEIAALSHFSERQILRCMQALKTRGLDGLNTGRSSGRPRALSQDEMKEKIMPLVDEPSKANQSHWTAVKLHGWIKEKLQIELGYSTTARYLHEQDYKLKVPRPWPLNHDEEARQAFCEKLQSWQKDESIDLSLNLKA